MTDAEFYRGIQQKYAHRQQQKRKRWLLTTVAVGMIGLLALAAAAVPLMTGGGVPVDLPTTTTHSSTVGTLSTTTTNDGQYTTQPTTTVTDTTGSDATTTTTDPGGIGGDSPYTDNPFAERFWVDSPFSVRDVIDLDDYHAWCKEFEYNGGSLPDYEKNIYTFIQKFNIPRETVEELCRKERDRQNPGNAYVLWGNLMSDADVEVLYTKTKAEVYAYFCAKYAVTVGEKAYSAYWLATHTAEEYTAEGITAAQIQEVTRFLHLADLYFGEDHIREQLILMGGTPATTPTTDPEDPDEVTVIFGDQWSDYSTDFQAFLTACGLTKEVITKPATPNISSLDAFECSNAYMTARFESGLHFHTLSDAWFSPVFSGSEKTQPEIEAIAERFARWRIDVTDFNKHTRTVTYDADSKRYTITYRRVIEGYETFDSLTITLLADGQVVSYHEQDLNSFCFDTVPEFDESQLRQIAEERLTVRYPNIERVEWISTRLTIRSYWKPAIYRTSNVQPYNYYGNPYLRTPSAVFSYRLYLTDGTVVEDLIGVELEPAAQESSSVWSSTTTTLTQKTPPSYSYN